MVRFLDYCSLQEGDRGSQLELSAAPTAGTRIRTRVSFPKGRTPMVSKKQKIQSLIGILYLSSALFVGTALDGQIPLTPPDQIEYPTADGELRDWIEQQLGSIGDVRKVGRADLERIFYFVDSGIAGAEFHLKTYPESPARARVLYLLARLLYLNVDRQLVLADKTNEIEWGARFSEVEKAAFLGEYRERIFSLIAAALALDPSPATIAGLRETRGEILFRMKQPQAAAREFEVAIEAHPENPALAENYIKLGEAHLSIGAYEEVERVARAALEKFPRSTLWPHFFWYLAKAYRHQGKSEEALEAWSQILPILEAGAAGKPLVLAQNYVVPERYRIDYGRYADRAGFYRGFYLYALGRVEEAHKAFQDYTDGLHARIGEGQTLGMDIKAYLDFQADPMERRLSLLQGEKLPPLKDVLRWLVPPKADAPEEGVRIRIFSSARNMTDRRQALVSLLEQLRQEYSEQGLRIEWVALSLSDKQQSVDKERATAGALALRNNLDEWAIGIDVGYDAAAHTEHFVQPGSGTMFVTDQEGRMAWQLIDPMGWDEGLIRSVIARLIDPDSSSSDRGD